MSHRSATRVRATSRAAISTGALTHIVDLARRAPSIHNTQPWTWVAREGRLELWRDPDRQLPASDPSGRQQVISCGASLHHALVAARATGWEPAVSHLPDPTRPGLLARIAFSPATCLSDLDLARVIPERCTDRRRFTSWPLPAARVSRLAQPPGDGWSCVVPVLDAAARVRVERLVEWARRTQLRDAAISEETAQWVGRGDDDGIPTSVLPTVTGVAGEHPHRFDPGPEGLDPSLLRSSDGLVIVATPEDDPRGWLIAGATLSELWLRAVLEGLSVVPLAQAIEDDTARAGLRGELRPPYRQPQALVRLGWPVISRKTLPRTPRRPLEEVFHEH